VVYAGTVVGVHEEKRDAEAQAERMNAIPESELFDDVPVCSADLDDEEVTDEVTADLAQLHLTEIVTSRYAGFKREFGVPVRITVGAPRFWKTASQGQLEEVSELAPRERIFWREPMPSDGEMIPVYEQRLAKYATSIFAKLAAIARAHPGERLVLLCYEKPGESCHRWWFAAWAKRYGLSIPELEVT
jgi:hypothetical protein